MQIDIALKEIQGLGFDWMEADAIADGDEIRLIFPAPALELKIPVRSLSALVSLSELNAGKAHGIEERLSDLESVFAAQMAQISELQSRATTQDIVGESLSAMAKRIAALELWQIKAEGTLSRLAIRVGGLEAEKKGLSDRLDGTEERLMAQEARLDAQAYMVGGLLRHHGPEANP